MTQPALSEILPHADPMLLLDELVEWDDRHAVCAVTIRPDSMFAEDGRVPAWAGVEYCAQCVAAFVGLRGLRRGEKLQLGFLVAVRDMTLEIDHFEPGQELRIEARLQWGEIRVGRFECKIELAGAVVARAILSVYQPEESDGTVEG